MTIRAISAVTGSARVTHQFLQSPPPPNGLKRVLPPDLPPKVVFEHLSSGRFWVQGTGPAYFPSADPHRQLSIQPIVITQGPNDQPTVSAIFVGGLKSLMNAYFALQDHPDTTVVIVSHGRKIADNAGLQLHLHSTQWADYTLTGLAEDLCRSNGILNQKNPHSTAYSSLHIPIDSIADLNRLMQFGLYMIGRKLDPSTKGNVGTEDHQLVAKIRQSIENLKVLDTDVFNVVGKHILFQKGRYYWSDNPVDLEKKEAIWQQLGIVTERVDTATLSRHTLLKPDFAGTGIFIPSDGELNPHFESIMHAYLLKKFPDRCHIIDASISEIRVDTAAHTVQASYIKDGQTTSLTAGHAYVSVGHDQVRLDRPDGPQIYKETPISGISINARCTLSKAEIMSRIPTGMTLDTFLESGELRPSADLRNLHVKTLPETTRHADGSVTLRVRISEGGHFGRYTAHPQDLENIAFKITELFDGKWEFDSIGSCTRKSGISNSIETLYFPTQNPVVTFNANNSGVGISTIGDKR